MSDCTRYADDLKALVDGELPFARRWVVERHVAACPQCRDEAAAMRQIGEGLRLQTPEPLDPALRARILAAIPEGSPVRVRRPMPRRISLALAGSVAGIAALVVLFLPATHQFIDRAPELAKEVAAPSAAGSAASAPASQVPPAVNLETRSKAANTSEQDYDEVAPKRPLAGFHGSRETAKAKSESPHVAAISPKVVVAQPDNRKAPPEPRPLASLKAASKPAVASADKTSALREQEELRDRASLNAIRDLSSGPNSRFAASKNSGIPGLNTPAGSVTAPAAGKPLQQGIDAKAQDASKRSDLYSFGAAGMGGRAAGGARGEPGSFGRAGGGFGGGGLGGMAGGANAPAQTSAGATAAASPAGPAGPAGKPENSLARRVRGMDSLGLVLGAKVDPARPETVLLGLAVTDVPTKRAVISQLAKEAKGRFWELSLDQKKDSAANADVVFELQIDPAEVNSVVGKLEKLGEVTEKVVDGKPETDLRSGALMESVKRTREPKEQSSNDKPARTDNELLQKPAGTRQFNGFQPQVRLEYQDQTANRRLARPAVITVKLKEKRAAAATAPAAKPAAPPPKK